MLELLNPHQHRRRERSEHVRDMLDIAVVVLQPAELSVLWVEA
jgi:hypothetical protein